MLYKSYLGLLVPCTVNSISSPRDSFFVSISTSFLFLTLQNFSVLTISFSQVSLYSVLALYLNSSYQKSKLTCLDYKSLILFLCESVIEKTPLKKAKESTIILALGVNWVLFRQIFNNVTRPIVNIEISIVRDMHLIDNYYYRMSPKVCINYKSLHLFEQSTSFKIL